MTPNHQATERAAQEKLLGSSKSDRGHHIRTHSGKKFYFADVRPEDIDIKDIAHALSNLCRYNGHTRDFYSVAEHCYYVSLVVPAEHALAALLHDANEAYLSDIPSPEKWYLGEKVGDALKDLEERVDRAIFDRFGVDCPIDPCVHEADGRMLVTEMRDLFSHFEGWHDMPQPYAHISTGMPRAPWAARAAFLHRFDLLTRNR